MKRYILGSLLVFVGLVVGSELAARAWYYSRRCTACSEMGTRSYRLGNASAGDLVPNQNGIWMVWPDRPFRVITNGVGLRNRKPLLLDPVLRVLALGDSFTFGVYVPNGDAWPARLESLLRLHAQRSDIEVLNAGVSGYTISDELSYYRDKGARLDPDIVILGFFANDLPDFSVTNRRLFGREARTESSRTDLSGLRGWMAGNSALYRLASQLKRALLLGAAEIAASSGSQGIASTPGRKVLHGEQWSPDRQRAFWAAELDRHGKAYRQAFEGLVTAVRQSGATLLVVAFPEFVQLAEGTPDLPQRFLEGLCREHGVPYLDLLPVYRTVGSAEQLYLLASEPTDGPESTKPGVATAVTGNGHLSRFGQLQSARAIATFLETRGLLRVR